MAGKQQLNVLVVDRDEGSIAQIKNFLTDEGYQVQTQTDLAQVVSEIKKGRYQLILLDVSQIGRAHV